MDKRQNLTSRFCGRPKRAPQSAQRYSPMATAGIILLVLGAFITLANVYLSFVRYPMHLALGGTRETYRWVSCFPLVGSLFLWLSIPLLSSVGLRWFAAALSLFDTGGIHWFVGTMWWTGQLGAFIRGCKDGE